MQPALMPYRSEDLPPGVRSRLVPGVNGLQVHVLEAGFETGGRPGVLLLHGFPELAYSWRNVMAPIASAGFHVIAPDRRGYGTTCPSPVGYDDDLRPFSTMNQVTDALALLSALGLPSVEAVIGHDQGSPLAGWCALMRPDVFHSVVMMSAPFGGAPPVAPPPDPIYDDLARLRPPRKHYQHYYQTREANQNLWQPAQGVHAFLRAYYHMKSADWPANAPHRLAARTAEEWAKMPRYYIMDLDAGMAETVATEMPAADQVAACRWLPDRELRVYSDEYGRNGFQGGLNGYRPRPDSGLSVFAGRTIDVPSMFVGGSRDWGVYQIPGALERLETVHTTRYRDTHLVDGAGHWVQQEQPARVADLLVRFLDENASSR